MFDDSLKRLMCPPASLKKEMKRKQISHAGNLSQKRSARQKFVCFTFHRGGEIRNSLVLIQELDVLVILANGTLGQVVPLFADETKFQHIKNHVTSRNK